MLASVDLPEEHDSPEFIDDENVENELYEHHRIVADKGQSLLRIDKFLMSRIENASRNKIQQAAKAGNILVNNVAVKSNYRIKPQDVISVVMTHPPRETVVLPENIPLNILFEDDHLIVINKNPGMPILMELCSMRWFGICAINREQNPMPCRYWSIASTRTLRALFW